METARQSLDFQTVNLAIKGACDTPESISHAAPDCDQLRANFRALLPTEYGGVFTDPPRERIQEFILSFLARASKNVDEVSGLSGVLMMATTKRRADSKLYAWQTLAEELGHAAVEDFLAKFHAHLGVLCKPE